MGMLLNRALHYCNDWCNIAEGTNRFNPTVSIIIPAYFPQHLNCVLEHLQRLGGFFEIIVVDDSGKYLLSPKSIAENVKLISHHRNLGRSAARNTGAFYAKGDILLFLDQDMYLSPLFLTQMKQYFASNHESVIVLGLRDTVAYSEIPSVDNWLEPSRYNDWRKSIIVSDMMVDLTATEVGAVDNNCSLGEQISIYDSTDGLRKLGISPEKTIGFWDIASMVISHSMSISKNDFFAIGGFPEWIEGWGGEDIVLGFLSIAYGLPIVLMDVMSYQELHPPYSGSERTKLLELRRNIAYYHIWLKNINNFPIFPYDECLHRATPLI